MPDGTICPSDMLLSVFLAVLDTWKYTQSMDTWKPTEESVSA